MIAFCLFVYNNPTKKKKRVKKKERKIEKKKRKIKEHNGDIFFSFLGLGVTFVVFFLFPFDS